MAPIRLWLRPIDHVEHRQANQTGFNAEYLLEALRTFGGRGSNAWVSLCGHDLTC
jgi:hypothetical protein